MRCGFVILADPHPNALEGIRRMLAPEVSSIMMVAEGGALLQAIEKMEPDLVIADLSLPIPGNRNIVRLLKQHAPSTRLIIMSMDDEATVLHEVMAAGAEGFLLKRRIATDLLPAIAAVCQRRRYISPDVDQRERYATDLTGIPKEKNAQGHGEDL